MTCKWCADTKTMYWDADERGCPPPPKGHDPEAEWDLMEASTYYNNLILLGNDVLKCTIPCPVCVGFGMARDQPFNVSPESRIDKEQPPGTPPPTAEELWCRQYMAMLAFVEVMAGIGFRRMEEMVGLSRQNWLKAALIREEFRTSRLPTWPKAEWDYKGGLCPSCGSGNFAPTYHARTMEKAIGCCDCGMAWILPEQPEKLPAEIERRKLELAGMRHTLERSFLLSPGEAEMLLSRYGYDLIDRVYRFQPST